MKDEFVKISDYIESLERRISALETLLAAAKATEAEQIDEIKRLSVNINHLETQIQELEKRTTNIDSTTEPEIEIEIITDDEMEEEVCHSDEAKNLPENGPAAADSLDMDTADHSAVEKEIITNEMTAVDETTADEKTYNPIQTTLFGTPVNDIRQAISLGDRFLFQRELFNGKGEVMQKTLESINQLTCFDEAIDYITGLGWDKESSTYELFVNILHRRFAE